MIRVKLDLIETWKREETIEVSSNDVIDWMENDPERWVGKTVADAAEAYATLLWNDGDLFEELKYTAPGTRPHDEFIDSEVDYAEVVES